MTLELLVVRKWLTDRSSVGELSAGGKMFCYTLEDKVRKSKVWGVTAIPEGTFEITWTLSPHFKRWMPMLVAVPNYDRCYFHSGNVAENTDGCTLTGYTRTQNGVVVPDWIGESHNADLALRAIIINAFDGARVTYQNAPVSDERTSDE